MAIGSSAGSLKAKVAKGSMWVALEQFVVQSVNFGMGILLARLLGPETFGTVALVTIFMAVAQVLAIAGLGQALVQKADSDGEDFDSVFCASIAMATILYFVLFAAAPAIARFYSVAALKPIVRVLALNLFFFSISSIQNAALFKEMRFDVTFRVSVATSGVSAVVGVGLALFGCGVWVLVFSSVLSNATGVAVRMLYVNWRPHLRYNPDRLKPLFAFGWKLMVSSLLATLVTNLYGVLIGRFYTKSDLAFVNRGRNIPELIGNNIRTSIIESSFPALSQLNGDRVRMTAALHRVLSVVAFVILPIMAVLATVAPRLIPFLYGTAWRMSVPYAQLMCVSGVVWTVIAVNSTALMAIGRSDCLLKLGICMNVVSLSVMFIFLPRGILPWMLICAFAIGPLLLTLYVWTVSRRLDFGFRAQFRDVLPSLLLTAVTALPVVALGMIPVGDLVVLTIQGVVAVTVYLSLSVLFKVSALGEILRILVPKLPFDGRLMQWLNRRFDLNKDFHP